MEIIIYFFSLYLAIGYTRIAYSNLCKIDNLSIMDAIQKWPLLAQYFTVGLLWPYIVFCTKKLP